jgi:chromosome segregation ATPase
MSEMKDEGQARTQVLLEDLKRDIGVIADGHLLLGQKIDGLGGRLERVEGKLERVEIRLGAVEDRVGSVEGRLGSVEGQLKEFQHETRQNFEVVAARLDGLREEVRERFAVVDGRLERMSEHQMVSDARLERVEKRLENGGADHPAGASSGRKAARRPR